MLATSDHPSLNDVLDGLASVYRNEGLRGLYRGTTLALVGVSNGAIQFMGYERLKWLCFQQKRKGYEKVGRAWTRSDDKLVSQIRHHRADHSVDHCVWVFFAPAVQHNIHCYFWSLKVGCPGSHIPISGCPIKGAGLFSKSSLCFPKTDDHRIARTMRLLICIPRFPPPSGELSQRRVFEGSIVV